MTVKQDCIIFILSILLILSLPAITKGEEWATYDTPNITYGAISCGGGQTHPDQFAYWCWINYTNKVMDHSFFTYEAMDTYYNSSDNLTGGETYTLSAYQEPGITTASEPGMISSIFSFILALFEPN